MIEQIIMVKKNYKKKILEGKNNSEAQKITEINLLTAKMAEKICQVLKAMGKKPWSKNVGYENSKLLFCVCVSGFMNVQYFIDSFEFKKIIPQKFGSIKLEILEPPLAAVSLVSSDFIQYLLGNFHPS